MRVADLKKGMVLHVTDTERVAWLRLTDKHLFSSGEPEVRFIHKFMIPLIHGPIISDDELIIYLGHDKVPVDEKDPTYKKIVRRIMIGEKTAIVLGHNFRYFEPHPDFL